MGLPDRIDLTDQIGLLLHTSRAQSELVELARRPAILGRIVVRPHVQRLYLLASCVRDIRSGLAPWSGPYWPAGSPTLALENGV